MEFAELCEGFRWRQREQWERLAWLAAQIINVSGKYVTHKVTPKELLDGGGRVFDPIARHQAFQSIKEKLERREKNGDGR